MPTNVTTNFTIESDEVYVSTSGATFSISSQQQAQEFYNYGVIRATGLDARAIIAGGMGGLIVNAGLIEVATTSTAIGIYGGGWMPAVRNTGRLVVSGTNAFGVQTWSPGQVIENSGVITVTGTGQATGLALINGGSISQTGWIVVTGGSAATGVFIDRFEGSRFENRGQIVADATGLSYGVVVSGLAGNVTQPNIVNRGTITADIAIQGRDGGYSPPQNTIENVANYGVLNGGVSLGLGADVVRNYGVINGDVDRGSGADLVDLSQGGVNGRIRLGDDDDTALGSSGADDISGGIGRDTIRGARGADRIDGEQGNDTLFGGDGDDMLIGGSGADILAGEAGDDQIEGGTGDETIDGGAGVDTVIFAGAFSDFVVTAAAGVTTVTGGGLGTDTLTRVERLRFSDRVVVLPNTNPSLELIGTAAVDVLTGGAGDDLIAGGGGADTLTGEDGADTFRYLAASDSTAAAQDTITDFQTNVDRIDLTALNPTSVSIARLAGGGTVIFAATPGGAFQTFAAGTSLNGGDIVFGGGYGVYVIGSDAADTILGTAVPDPIVGNGGDDVITGGAGADAIAGGAGRDVFRYVSRGDSNQQTGFDNLYDFTTGEDVIDLTAMNVTSVSILRSDNGSSFIYAETAQGVFLTTAANRSVQATDITYGAGPGGVGGFGIYMVGSAVNDVLVGTSLADPLYGREGNDTITGGGGADAMFGEGGIDTFVYLSASDSTQAATDGIFGFASGTDRLDLRAVRTGAADTYGIAYLAGGSFLFVDLGGNGTSDMVIGLAGTTLVAGDILWATGAIGEEPAVKDAGPQTLPGADAVDLIDTDMAFELSPYTGACIRYLDGARGLHGQDWYL